MCNTAGFLRLAPFPGQMASKQLHELPTLHRLSHEPSHATRRERVLVFLRHVGADRNDGHTMTTRCLHIGIRPFLSTNRPAAAQPCSL